MPLEFLCLDGSDWEFLKIQTPKKHPETIPYLSQLDKKQWIYSGQVPGNVQTDLLANHQIDDPFLDCNTKTITWIEQFDWVYRKHFTINESQLHMHSRLIFKGVDYEAHFFLNDHYLGYHEGMFGHVVFDVQSYLQKGPNLLMVWLRAPSHYTGFRQQYPRIQMTYGWDISCRVLTAGIWDSILIEFSQPVYFLYDSPQIGYSENEINLKFALRRSQSNQAILDHDSPFQIKYQIIPENFEGESIEEIVQMQYNITLEEDDRQYQLDLSAYRDQIQLWWPWELGFPHLYTVVLELIIDNQTYDRIAFISGFRKIERKMNPEAAVNDLPWTFHINNTPIYLRGTNWVPLDVFPGAVSDDRYRNSLQQIRDVGMNIIRVWGGGLWEKEIFFQLCDRLGLMVWQEFPIACIMFPAFPKTIPIINLWHHEARSMIQRVRAHPSLTQLSGGNENNVWQNRHIIGILQDLCADLMSEIPFQGSSPMEGQGETHNYQVWHGYAAFPTIQSENAAVCSEFGMMASPSKETWTKTLSPAQRHPWSQAFMHHFPQFTLFYGSKMRIQRYMLPFLHRWNGNMLDGFVEATQTAQAQYMQIAIEHFRRRKPINSGFMTWQWNEPWPEISLGAIDYYGHPKKVFETYRQVCAPVLISIQYPFQRYSPGMSFEGDLYVINDLQIGFEAQIIGMCNDKPILDEIIQLSKNCVELLDHLKFNIPQTDNYSRMEFIIRPVISSENQAILSEKYRNTYDLDYDDPIPNTKLATFQKRTSQIFLSTDHNLRRVLWPTLQQYSYNLLVNWHFWKLWRQKSEKKDSQTIDLNKSKTM